MNQSSAHDISLIRLSTEKELRTYMHPLRQKILRTLRLNPDGMTAKQLADHLNIAPSSAGHHLAALEQIGVVKQARTERIHGFTARFYQVSDNMVTLSDAEEDAADLRETLLRHGVEQVLSGYLTSLQTPAEDGTSPHPQDRMDFFGIWYFTKDEAAALSETIRTFLDSHKKPTPGSVPYELALIAHSPKEDV